MLLNQQGRHAYHEIWPLSFRGVSVLCYCYALVASKPRMLCFAKPREGGSVTYWEAHSALDQMTRIDPIPSLCVTLRLRSVGHLFFHAHTALNPGPSAPMSLNLQSQNPMICNEVLRCLIDVLFFKSVSPWLQFLMSVYIVGYNGTRSFLPCHNCKLRYHRINSSR